MASLFLLPLSLPVILQTATLKAESLLKRSVTMAFEPSNFAVASIQIMIGPTVFPNLYRLPLSIPLQFFSLSPTHFRNLRVVPVCLLSYLKTKCSSSSNRWVIAGRLNCHSLTTPPVTFIEYSHHLQLESCHLLS